VGGENVAPTEIEHTILELPFVQGAVVAGERNLLLGEIVTARVALAAPLPPRDAEKRIRAYCRERLAPHKVPVKVEFVELGLLNARQKTQRVQNDERSDAGGRLQ
jgi:acyl-coenzyme A synthetase/AMP-(fatty) acid ligase